VEEFQNLNNFQVINVTRC